MAILQKLVDGYFVMNPVVFNFYYLRKEVPENGIKLPCQSFRCVKERNTVRIMALFSYCYV